MASEDLEWLLRQFSCGGGGSSLPSLKSSGLHQDAHAGAGSLSKFAWPPQGNEDGIQDSFREILSRSPYIFVANKRQEALLVQAASMEKPVFKFTSTVPSNLPSSIKQSLSPPRADVPLRPPPNPSPKQVAAAASPVHALAAIPRNGRLSAPPMLETAGTSEKAVEKRGKHAVILRLDQLRADDEVRALFQQKVDRYLAREKSPSAASGSGRLSPLQKNRRGARLQTLQNRINRLEELRVVRLVLAAACILRAPRSRPVIFLFSRAGEGAHDGTCARVADQPAANVHGQDDGEEPARAVAGAEAGAAARARNSKGEGRAVAKMGHHMPGDQFADIHAESFCLVAAEDAAAEAAQVLDAGGDEDVQAVSAVEGNAAL
jgi:hypothetical protein